MLSFLPSDFSNVLEKFHREHPHGDGRPPVACDPGILVSQRNEWIAFYNLSISLENYFSPRRWFRYVYCAEGSDESSLYKSRHHALSEWNMASDCIHRGGYIPSCRGNETLPHCRSTFPKSFCRSSSSRRYLLSCTIFCHNQSHRRSSIDSQERSTGALLFFEGLPISDSS